MISVLFNESSYGRPSWEEEGKDTPTLRKAPFVLYIQHRQITVFGGIEFHFKKLEVTLTPSRTASESVDFFNGVCG